MTRQGLAWRIGGSAITVLLAASLAGLNAGQLPAGGAVKIGNDDIGGVVTGPRGPEAGVWVIAETGGLPTRLIKIVVTDDQGTAKFSDLAPGPIALEVTAEGYNPAEEAASVVAGQSSEVAVGMTEVKKRAPATINGVVHSTVGGKPVAADLEIPQAKIKTKANATGAFSFHLEGGTYTVNISAPGFLSQRKSVTVKDGDQAILNVDLHPK